MRKLFTLVAFLIAFVTSIVADAQNYPYEGCYAVFASNGRCQPCQKYSTPLNEIKVFLYGTYENGDYDIECLDYEGMNFFGTSDVILANSDALVLDPKTPIHINDFYNSQPVENVSYLVSDMGIVKGYIAWLELETHGSGYYIFRAPVKYSFENGHLVIKLDY